MYYIENEGNATLPIYNNHQLYPFGMVDTGSLHGAFEVGSSTNNKYSVVDVNNDELYDIIVVTGTDFYVFLNTGTKENPTFDNGYELNPYDLTGTGINYDIYDLTFADIDGGK